MVYYRSKGNQMTQPSQPAPSAEAARAFADEIECSASVHWQLAGKRKRLVIAALRAYGGEEWRENYHKLDTPDQVFFYEQDFYVLSNFSAFNLYWRDREFYNSEVAYHFEKFAGVRDANEIRISLLCAKSAHDAFKIAEKNKHLRRQGWDAVKVDIMRDILRAKANQHEYVRRKLLATGDRELIEDSWRDDFWGWGPNRDGENMLGKLWMEIRTELRGAVQYDDQPSDETGQGAGVLGERQGEE